MHVTEKRAAALKKLLTHARERLGLDVGFVLWDGSTAPAKLPGESFAIVIADEGVIAALLRRPKLATLLDVWVSGRVDIRNGTIFDLAHVRPKVRTRQFLRSIDKSLLLATIARFAFVPRGGPWPLENLASDRSSSGDARQDAAFIQYHYDISNTFYALFLDPELVYSCAYFQQWTNDLATAQYAKLEMICRKLRLKAGDSLLDVGCGWGALACHAAAHYGVRVHGITLSQQQLVYATEKAARLRLQGEVTFELKDHRSLQGSFDKIASIGMFEHVGIDHHSEYFHAIHRLLKPAGLYLHHAIVRPAKRSDREFRKKRPEYSVIIRHIFPGAELDHIGMSIANLERFGFEVHDVEGWREHYARTLRHWHDRLLANREAADREVGRERTRLWLAYLATCSIAFERGTLGIFQTLASKRTRGAAGLPPTRADLYR